MLETLIEAGRSTPASRDRAKSVSASVRLVVAAGLVLALAACGASDIAEPGVNRRSTSPETTVGGGEDRSSTRPSAPTSGPLTSGPLTSGPLTSGLPTAGLASDVDDRTSDSVDGERSDDDSGDEASTDANFGPGNNRSPNTTSASDLTGPAASEPVVERAPAAGVRTGAEQLVDGGFAGLRGQRVALIANQTSMVDGRHLIDLLHAAPDVELVAVFAPEHGVRGREDAGADIGDTVDPSTRVPVLSIYGSTRAPTPEMLVGVDVVIYDLQDVGARYYTYVSTMGLSMQAASRSGASFMVLDRPDVGGAVTVDGFVRDPSEESFVSQYPIPAQYAMTSGELAGAIKGERWLDGLEGLNLTIIELDGYQRGMDWASLGREWIPPSPGLPSAEGALTYPSLVLFETVEMSVGRGTPGQFQLFGAPWIDAPALAAELNGRDLAGVDFEAVRFTPQAVPGLSEGPFEGTEVPGVRLEVTDTTRFKATSVGVHVLDATQRQANEVGVGQLIERPDFFDLLAGTSRVREGLTNGTPAENIVASWAEEAAAFEAVRAKYLLYPPA